MPYALHSLFTFRGTLGAQASGQDIWQFGIRTRNDGTADGSAPAQEAVDKAFGAFESMMSTLAFSSATKFEEVRGYNIGTDGKAQGVPNSKTRLTPLAGQSTTSLHPWSVSQCITLDAGGARGGRFGRFYLPPTAASVDPSGRITTTAADNAAVAWRDFLAAAFGASSTGQIHVPVVASARYGTLRTVQQVRVGDVLDTQRRRDNRLNEYYGSADVA